MKLLALDASTDWLAVAVGDGRHWHALGELAGQLHSQRLLPVVQQLLAAAGWRLADLDGIAFGAGPGSFTGIRIACGVVQGLALGASLPVVPVGTLEALAQAAWNASGATRVLPVLDARMREVYAAAYERHGTGWTCQQVPHAIAPDQWTLPQGQWTGVGDGYTRFPGLAAHRQVAALLADLRPCARAIGELALPRFAAGQGMPARDAQPLYVRDRVALTTAERAAGERLQA